VYSPILPRIFHSGLLLLAGAALTASRQVTSSRTSTTAHVHEMILPSTEMSGLLPQTLFFRGQQMPVEPRNAEGIRFADGRYLLIAILDSSGHATNPDTGHLACILTEVPLAINKYRVGPGVYEVGLDSRHHFVIMDIAAQRIFAADSRHDLTLSRPRPLQIISASWAGGYRLYLGRDYVSISRASQGMK
jgi:hypothetical protein